MGKVTVKISFLYGEVNTVKLSKRVASDLQTAYSKYIRKPESFEGNGFYSHRVDANESIQIQLGFVSSIVIQ